MLSTLAGPAAAFHGGFGFLPFLIIPHIIGFVLFILLIVFLIGGRRRRMARWAAMGGHGGFGPGGFGPWGHGGWGQSARAAETTLAERFAQGDIDEKEYRARLEVLRANNAGPQMPTK